MRSVLPTIIQAISVKIGQDIVVVRLHVIGTEFFVCACINIPIDGATTQRAAERYVAAQSVLLP